MKFLTLIISIIICATSGCAKKPDNSMVLAVVNNEKITSMMLDEKIDDLPEYYQSAAAQHKDEILNDLIVEKLLFEEAKKRKLHKDDDVRSLVEKAVQKILIAKLLEIETSPRKIFSDEDIQNHYNLNKEQYLIPERYKASHILLSTEEEANNILVELNAGGDFAQLAKKYSKDLTKDRGGDLGYFQKGQMIPEFEKVCFELSPGEISGIVKTRFGYHIIKLTDKKPAEYKPLDGVKENIANALADQEKQKQFHDFVAGLKDKADIQIKEKLSE